MYLIHQRKTKEIAEADKYVFSVEPRNAFDTAATYDQGKSLTGSRSADSGSDGATVARDSSRLR